MVLGDLNLNKWTLSVPPLVLCQKRTPAWALTSKNNEFLSWLDNWRYNEGERKDWDEERESKCVCVCVCERECPIFFVIALGAGYIHPQHCNLLFTPLPGKKKRPKVSWAQIQSVSCDTIVICASPESSTATSLNVLRCAVCLHVLMLTTST